MTARPRCLTDRAPDARQLDEHPCRCALCLALLDAAVRAERLRTVRRGTMAVVDGGKR